MVINVQNIFMEHDLYFIYWFLALKIYNFDPYNLFLAINIPLDALQKTIIMN